MSREGTVLVTPAPTQRHVYSQGLLSDWPNKIFSLHNTVDNELLLKILDIFFIIEVYYRRCRRQEFMGEGIGNGREFTVKNC